MVSTASDQNLTPDRDQMLAHLRLAFGEEMEGRIEIAWTDTKGDVKNAETFALDRLEDAVALAVKRNSQPGVNVYFGVALRDEDVSPVGRCDDADVLGTSFLQVDLDDQGAAETAQERLRATALPTYTVVTGRHPYIRLQCFWRVDEMIHDQATMTATLQAMAHRLGGDPKVCNPSRVMRLGGSIAWPHKEGRQAEMTEFRAVMPYPYGLDRLKAVFELDQAHAELGAQDGDILDRDIELGPADHLGIRVKVLDGREVHMRDTVLAVLIELVGTTGAEPTAQELFDTAWPQFARTADMIRPGHISQKEMMSKVRYTLRRFHMKQIPGLPDIDAMVASYRARHGLKVVKQTQALPPQQDDRLYALVRYTDMGAVDEADDFVEDTLTRGALSVVYGPSGVGKTFMVLDLALCVATGAPWHGKEVEQAGVIYVAAEGAGGVQKRVAAYKLAHPELGDIPFAMIPDQVNMLDGDTDVVRLIATIQRRADQLGAPVGLIVIDTLAASMIGGDENSFEGMGLFIANALAIQHATGAHVLIVHHSGKDAGRGARGHSSLRAATDTEIELSRDEGDSETLVHIVKQRDMEVGARHRFVLRQVALGTNRRGKAITSCTVEYLGEHVPRYTSPLSTLQIHTIFDEIKRRWNGGVAFGKNKQSGGRWLTGYLVNEYRLNVKVAQSFVDAWERNECLRDEMHNTHTKARGWRVISVPATPTYT